MLRMEYAHHRGFTLLEALVVLALLGVLLALAAPGMSDLRQKHQMQSQAEQLQAALLLARSEALRRQQRVTLCVKGQRGPGHRAGWCLSMATTTLFATGMKRFCRCRPRCPLF